MENDCLVGEARETWLIPSSQALCEVGCGAAVIAGIAKGTKKSG